VPAGNNRTRRDDIRRGHNGESTARSLEILIKKHREIRKVHRHLGCRIPDEKPSGRVTRSDRRRWLLLRTKGTSNRALFDLDSEQQALFEVRRG